MEKPSLLELLSILRLIRKFGAKLEEIVSFYIFLLKIFDNCYG
jgi:hypothetical protein